MKYIVLICFLILPGLKLTGQIAVETNEGKVSYITSQNVYVKFKSTKQISIGDTLFFRQNNNLIPALQVTNLSSISCVCLPISTISLSVNDKLVTRQIKTDDRAQEADTNVVETIVPVLVNEEPGRNDSTIKTNEQQIDGRISVSSYSNFSNTEGGNSQRMRYTFSMKAKNIADSKFSAETYLSFVHSDNNWNEIKENVFNGLKVYNLAVKYQPVESMSIWLGRKINPSISSIGAIDGLQLENTFKSIIAGAFVGSRPDYTDYSYNFNLFQFGAYVGHVFKNKKNLEMRSTLAFVEQENDWKTDRRFAYFQHYNALVKNLYFFATAELELYQVVNGVAQSSFNLTNLYLMLRYRVIRQLSFSVSYSSRQNLIYYETYKDFVERLIEQETLQGFRFQVNYRPIRNLTIGLKAGYRSRKDDPIPSKNLNGYISYSRIPGINVSTTLSATILETSYLSGTIYSLRLARDIIPGKLYSSLSYRYVDYEYSYYESTLTQHVGDININWRIIRKLSLSLTYEGVFESTNQYSRLFINLTQRF